MSYEKSPDEANRPSPRPHETAAEYVFTSQEVAEAIGVTTSTIRKYSMTLESNEYDIMRDEHKRRMYTDADITLLRAMLKYARNGLSVDSAANAAIGESADKQVSTEARREVNDDEIQELKDMIQRQNEMIGQLSSRLDEQEKRRDERDQALMQSLNESLETQKQLAANEKKKGFFAKLFGRENKNG